MTFETSALVGESKLCQDHPTKKIHISVLHARKLAELVSKEMKWPLFKIQYSDRKTVERHATSWPRQHRIIIYKKGESVCTVLHELAHYKSVCHDKSFKETHLVLLKIWSEKWQQIIVK